ncbi:MAG TPA: hypothetical protein VN924_30150 [Bryobacteraceae bacterium]|nr:hypothetical protein [Bryobacteraceae bacterium]
MQKLIAVVLLIVGSSAAVMAVPAPEIDPASGANALALIAGGLVILRSCRKK